MRNANINLHFSKLRISYLVAAIAVVVGLGCYGYHIYALAQDLKINRPQPQIEKLIKDLRIFHLRTRRFPASFIEMNQLIWRTTPMPNYGRDGRQARAKNYYYYYTKVNDETCAFWALPLGSQRHYASSFFIVLSPGWMRSWKGRAMSDEEVSQIPVIPSSSVLNELKMQEGPSRIFSTSNN
jgi:hypothetical protein